MDYAYLYCVNYVDYVKKAFNELKNITYSTSVRNRIDLALSRIDKAIEYENVNMTYLALEEIKKVFPEV